jgi:tryptophan synthase alpha chain
MTAIDETFATCRKEKRAAFIPFLMAGDPNLDTTSDLLEALAAGGADLIELGLPFSDPIADGPTNQRAAMRSLAAGTNLAGVLDVIARQRARLGVPIVLYTYYNLIHARGHELFADQAARSGVDGVLCVDLPPEEGARELGRSLDPSLGRSLDRSLERAGLDSIYLLAPTSTKERVKKVAAASSGFVYYVSRTGVTGQRDELPDDLEREVKRLRKKLPLPLAVGFGLSTPEQVRAVGAVADGVVVGSALVQLVESSAGDPRLPQRLEARVRELSDALRER